MDSFLHLSFRLDDVVRRVNVEVVFKFDPACDFFLNQYHRPKVREYTKFDEIRRAMGMLDPVRGISGGTHRDRERKTPMTTGYPEVAEAETSNNLNQEDEKNRWCVG